MRDLYAVKRDHGGRVYDGGRRWIGPGPGHSPRDASLSLLIGDDGKPLIYSFSDDPLDACKSHLGIEHTPSASLDRASYARVESARQAEAARRENAALAFCERLWGGGQPIEHSFGAGYFDSRAIDWFPADVRFHPSAPCGYTTTATAPAILALARSATGAPRAVQATFLTADGQARTSRATFGALIGAAVRLSPLEACLAVGEGLETCASFAKLEAIPTWATLGTANLVAFRPPPSVRHLVIAADGDAAGLKAARALAERLRSRCDVTIAAAPPGADWNDVATGKVDV